MCSSSRHATAVTISCVNVSTDSFPTPCLPPPPGCGQCSAIGGTWRPFFTGTSVRCFQQIVTLQSLVPFCTTHPTHHQVVVSWLLCSSLHPAFQYIQPEITNTKSITYWWPRVSLCQVYIWTPFQLNSCTKLQLVQNNCTPLGFTFCRLVLPQFQVNHHCSCEHWSVPVEKWSQK